MTFRPEPSIEDRLTDSTRAFKAAVTDDDPINSRILKLIVDLGNTVLYKKARAELHVIKMKNPDRFKQVALFRKTLTILETHHYRLPARQFVLDLFDKGVLHRIVLEEDGDDDLGSDTG